MTDNRIEEILEEYLKLLKTPTTDVDPSASASATLEIVKFLRDIEQEKTNPCKGIGFKTLQHELGKEINQDLQRRGISAPQ